MAVLVGVGLLAIVLILVVLALWVLGGGALLYVGGRYLAGSPRATHWRSVAVNAVSVLAGALASGAVIGVVLAVFGLELRALLIGNAVALLAGLLASWLVIRGALSVSFGKAVLAWLPTAWQLLFQPAVAMTIAAPFVIRAADQRDRAACARNLEKIGQACATRMVSLRFRGGMGPDKPLTMGSLAGSGYLPTIPRCPAAERRGAPAHGKYDYFLFAGRSVRMGGRQVIACDFAGNHGGDGRHVLSADGAVRWMGEAQFQQLLSQPGNAEFATALRRAEGP
jgi:hypothetical protein